LYRSVISLFSPLCLLVVPATAVARQDSPVIPDAKKHQRSLWGEDRGGKFRTRGNGSVATVRSNLIRAGQRQLTPRAR
jgi:hypothetical protein